MPVKKNPRINSAVRSVLPPIQARVGSRKGKSAENSCHCHAIIYGEALTQPFLLAFTLPNPHHPKNYPKIFPIFIHVNLYTSHINFYDVAVLGMLFTALNFAPAG